MSKDLIDAYPLTWPIGQPRTERSKRVVGRFTLSLASSFQELVSELDRLGALSVIVSTNAPVNSFGRPYADSNEPADPGVAVYFDRLVGTARKPFVIACDTYSRLRWNIRAIGMTVEAMRTIQRHGASSLLEQAFSGFASLPPAGHVKTWWEVLGVDKDATVEVVRAAYTELARMHHPDVEGGSHERMSEINQAFEQWKDAT